MSEPVNLNRKVAEELQRNGPVHTYTPAELASFAKSRGLEVSKNAGQPFKI